MPPGLLPASATPEAGLLLAARALRAFGDGLVSLLLPAYLAALGHGPFEIGLIATATLTGSSVFTSSSASTPIASPDAVCCSVHPC